MNEQERVESRQRALKKYYTTHQEELRAKKKEYYEKNRDKILEYNKEYYQKDENKKKRNEYMREYRRRKKEYLAAESKEDPDK